MWSNFKICSIVHLVKCVCFILQYFPCLLQWYLDLDRSTLWPTNIKYSLLYSFDNEFIALLSIFAAPLLKVLLYQPFTWIIKMIVLILFENLESKDFLCKTFKQENCIPVFWLCNILGIVKLYIDFLWSKVRYECPGICVGGTSQPLTPTLTFPSVCSRRHRSGRNHHGFNTRWGRLPQSASTFTLLIFHFLLSSPLSGSHVVALCSCTSKVI